MKSGNNGKCETCQEKDATSMNMCDDCWEKEYLTEFKAEFKTEYLTKFK